MLHISKNNGGHALILAFMHPRWTLGILDVWEESSYLGHATCGIWSPKEAGRAADTDRHSRSPRSPSSSAGSRCLLHTLLGRLREAKSCFLYGGVSLSPFSWFVLSATHSVLSAKWGKNVKKKKKGLKGRAADSGTGGTSALPR